MDKIDSFQFPVAKKRKKKWVKPKKRPKIKVTIKWATEQDPIRLSFD